MNVCPHSFEDLWIWQEARLLVAAIYSDFGPNSPGARDYIFKGQIQGCGISIMNNMYCVAEDVRYVTAEIAKERRAMALKITKGLSSLTQKLRQPHNTP